MSKRTAYLAASVMVVALLGFTFRFTHSHENHLSSQPESDHPSFANPSIISKRTYGGEPEVQKSNDQNMHNNPERKSALDYGLSYRQHRANINFNEDEFMKHLLSSNKKIFHEITESFKEIETLNSAIPQEESYVQTRPKALIARMGMMDLLKAYCSGDNDESAANQAKQSLRDVIDLSIPRSLPDHLKKILVSEKYDALKNLSQCDPEQALSAYESLSNSVLKSRLLEALQEGVSKSKDSDKGESILRNLQKNTKN